MPVPERWSSYFCNVNSELASIRLDLGKRETSPDSERPWLLWIWLRFKKPRTDGLSSSEEFEALGKIEDALTAGLEISCKAVLAGCVTTLGRREYYFYGSSKEQFESALHDAMAKFPSYEFASGNQLDAEWNQYLNVLYPSPEDLQKIQNREVLAVLEEKGDELKVARNVRHWIYFKKFDDREEFRRKAQAMGYRFEPDPQDSQTEPRYGLCLFKNQEMNAEAIDETVLELFRASQTCDGQYDGWECELILPAKKSSKKPWWKFIN